MLQMIESFTRCTGNIYEVTVLASDE